MNEPEASATDSPSLTTTVSIAPTQGSGALSLSVLNAQRTVLASGQATSAGVTLSVSLASGTQYYVKVSSPTGSLLAYSLSIAQSGGGGGGGGGAGKHLVVAGVANPDDQVTGDVFYRNAADDPENAGPVSHNPVASVSRPPSSDAVLATEPRASIALPATAGTCQDGVGSPRSPAGALLNLGHRTLPLVAAATSIPARPGTWPPVSRADSGGGEGALLTSEPADADPAAGLTPTVRLARPPFALEAAAQVGERFRWEAAHPGFARGFWASGAAELDVPAPDVAAEDSGTVSISAAAVLVVALGSWSAVRVDGEPRRRQRFLS